MALTLIDEENQIDTGNVPPAWKSRSATYRPELCDIALGASLFGANFRQVAETLGITEPTLMKWCNKHPELSEAINEGAERADLLVMRAFYKRALGYNVTTRRTHVRQTNKEGRNVVDREVIEITTHVPADVAAAKQWLHIRRGWAPENPNSWSLDDLFRFAELARAEAAKRGHDIAAAGRPLIEAGEGGSGIIDGENSDPE